MPGSFFDTNVLLYIAGVDPAKADRAEELIDAGGTISVQVLNEITKVARRKMGMSWDARVSLHDPRSVAGAASYHRHSRNGS